MFPRTLLRDLALVLVLAVAAPPALQAQERGSDLQRCERADGSQVYTDQDCRNLGAIPAPMEGELLMRLSSDTRGARSGHEPDAGLARTPPLPGKHAGATGHSHATPAAGRAGADTKAVRGCARSPTQLVMNLRAGWRDGDVNRLAANYHWTGSSTVDATSVMLRLQSLAALPLQEIHHYGAGGNGLVQVASAAAVPLGGIVQVTLGSGERTRLHDFRVVAHQGCHFIRF